MIIDPSHELGLAIQQILSYQVYGAEQTDAYTDGGWDGRASFYEMRKNRFPAGFVPAVIQKLTKMGYKLNVKRAPLPLPLGPERPIFDDYRYDDRRYDYQPETVDRLIRHGRLIAQVATGGGKSRIAQIATARIRRPTLFLTTRKLLMYQMRDHYVDMLKYMGETKHNVGVLGDSEWTPRQWINVGMVQTFAARLKPPSRRDPKEKQQAVAKRISETKRILERFELVILEEAHETGSDSYYDVMKRCKSSHYRLALTATPFMKDDEEANMKLMAVAGPVGIRVSEKQLIDSGILAKPYFKYLTPERPKHLRRTTSWGAAYRLGVVESVPRNALILQQAIIASRYKLSVLVLVQQQKHGKILEKAFRKNGISCKFIFGESSAPVRAAALNALVNGEMEVLIGSNILDVGVDCPALGMVILGAGGKAEVNLRQRIGRGLRAKKVGINAAYIVDFNDIHNKHLQKHSNARRAIVQQTEGFGENILKETDKFPFLLES